MALFNRYQMKTLIVWLTQVAFVTWRMEPFLRKAFKGGGRSDVDGLDEVAEKPGPRPVHRPVERDHWIDPDAPVDEDEEFEEDEEEDWDGPTPSSGGRPSFR